MTSYGPPTASEHLRQSMHGSINFRAQMVNDYAPPGSDIIERRWPFLWAVIFAMLAAAALWLGIIWAVGWLAVANAAERNSPRPHDLCRPNIFKIGAGYSDKDTCEKAKRRLVIRVAGTLQCHPFKEGE